MAVEWITSVTQRLGRCRIESPPLLNRGCGATRQKMKVTREKMNVSIQ
jgi:hypothetical protein